MHNPVTVRGRAYLRTELHLKTKDIKKENNNLARLVPDGQVHVLSLQLLAFYPVLKKYYCQIRALFLGRWSSPSFPLHQTENQESPPDLEKIWKKVLKIAISSNPVFKAYLLYDIIIKMIIKIFKNNDF